MFREADVSRRLCFWLLHEGDIPRVPKAFFYWASCSLSFFDSPLRCFVWMMLFEVDFFISMSLFFIFFLQQRRRTKSKRDKNTKREETDLLPRQPFFPKLTAAQAPLSKDLYFHALRGNLGFSILQLLLLYFIVSTPGAVPTKRKRANSIFK